MVADPISIARVSALYDHVIWCAVLSCFGACCNRKLPVGNNNLGLYCNQVGRALLVAGTIIMLRMRLQDVMPYKLLFLIRTSKTEKRACLFQIHCILQNHVPKAPV